MQIFVINLEGKTLTVDVEEGDEVYVLKRKIEEKTSLPLPRQRLTFNGKFLQNERFLCDYNIRRGSTVRLHLNRHSTEAASFNWAAFTTNAKINIDKEVEKKKVRHNQLLKRKVQLQEGASRIASEIIQMDRYYQIASISCSMTSDFIKEKEEEMTMLQNSIIEEKIILEVKEEDKMRIKKTLEKKKNEELQIQRDLASLEEDIDMVYTLDSDLIKKKGADVDNMLKGLIKKKEQLLKCPVCFEQSCPPIYKCTRDHLICNKCLPKVVRRKCPICRSQISSDGSQGFRYAEDSYEEMQKIKKQIMSSEDDVNEQATPEMFVKDAITADGNDKKIIVAQYSSYETDSSE